MEEGDIETYYDYFHESDGDEENGELTEKGKKKLLKLIEIKTILEEEESKSRDMLDKVRIWQYDALHTSESKRMEDLNKLLVSWGEAEITDFTKLQLFSLRFDLDKESGVNKLKDVNKIKLPSIKHCFLTITEETYDKVKTFFEDAFPTQVGSLLFNERKSRDTTNLLNFSRYSEMICFRSFAVTEELHISFAKITTDDMNAIVNSFCKVPTIQFIWCKFEFEEGDLDFRKAYSPTTQFISFEGCGDSSLNDWENNINQFEKIIEALSNSDFRKSIKTIETEDCNIDDGRAHEILRKYKIYN